MLWCACSAKYAGCCDLTAHLIPEFSRVVAAAGPAWFLMENVLDAPEPCVDGFMVRWVVLNNRQLGETQDRTRRFSLGTQQGLMLDRFLAHEIVNSPRPSGYSQAVTSGARSVPVKIGGSGRVKRTYTEGGERHGPGQGKRTRVADMLELQGLPRDYLDECPLTDSGKRQVIGNGVPLPMGRAIARAVKQATPA